MALGVNLQWGFAGLFNIGVMGFVALGGLAAVLVSMPPTTEAWQAGGLRVLVALVLGAATIAAAVLLYRAMGRGWLRALAIIVLLVGGFFIYRAILDPGVDAVEAINPAATGYLGGLGLPVIVAWPVGGLLAAGAAWLIGKTALGLRSDYLAIATLGIAEIIIAVLKNEDWLSPRRQERDRRPASRALRDRPAGRSRLCRPRGGLGLRPGRRPRRFTSSCSMPCCSWSSCWSCCGWRRRRWQAPGAA